MEDAFKDEFTEEELALLGESEGEKPPEKTEEANPEGTGTLETEPPAQETEKPAEKAAATETKEVPELLTEDEKKDVAAQGFKIETDAKGRTYITDAEGTKIPEKRFGKIYREGKEAENLRRENQELKEKQTLFKQLGPDGYYKIYPDEAPQGYNPPESRRAAPITDGFNVLNLAVNGGQYDGMTLQEVLAIDQVDGVRMLNEWKDTQQAEIRKQEETVTRAKMEQETEAFNFGMARAKELFGIDDASKLTPEHNRKLVLLGQEVLAWQRETKRLNLSWEDAYKLMKHDELIARAREEGASKTFKDLQKPGPASINTGAGGSDKATGWEAIEGMTESELTKHIDNLNDVESTKFFKTAPARLRDKYPGMPWE